ncbi:hypothetical protein HDC34_001632 [Pseudoclavibacter sp. JAI123]|uniref:hypothetical protein n=1 Tax=Pseudoclavibacter sp. JAI123 TaxID=2723065 RepID=UPI0015CD2AAB|nr:hypothetical protein [Pseudoclavibacter sp. JAI123]NYF13338.1 hypothetical protein [Pseudoclavibacter sp. JAI123]
MSGNDFEGFGRPNWQKPENGDEHAQESGDSVSEDQTSGHEGFGAHFGRPAEEPDAPAPSEDGPGQPEVSDGEVPAPVQYEAPAAPTWPRDAESAPAADAVGEGVEPASGDQSHPDENSTEVLGFGEGNETAVLGRGDHNQTEILDSGAPAAPSWEQTPPQNSSTWNDQGVSTPAPTGWDQTAQHDPNAWNDQSAPAQAPASWDQQPSAPAWGQSAPDAQDAQTTQTPAWNAPGAGQADPSQASGGLEAPAYGEVNSAPSYGGQNESPAFGSTAPEAGAAAFGVGYGAQQQAGAWNGAPENQTPAPYAPGQAPGQEFGAPAFGGNGGGGYQGGGPSGPNDFGNGAPAKKPWFRKPAILIPAIIGVVVLVGAAVAIPVTIHNNNVNRGDELAAAFQTDLDAHYADWTTENLDLAANVTISASLGENTDFFSQSAAQMTDFSTRCGNVATAETTINDLAGSTVPSLAVEDGADASEAYKAAQTESDGLSERRDIVANFADTASADVAALQQFCEAFPKYNSIYNTFGTQLASFSSTIFTIPDGQNIDLGNNLYYPCNVSTGCPDYSNPNIGTTIADGIKSTYVDFYRGIADLAASECFLDELADVCTSYSTEFGKAADAAQAAADSYRSETLSLTVGAVPFANSSTLFTAMFDTFDAADAAVQTAWWSADPSSDGQTDRGWQSRSLKTLLSAHESSIATLVESVR